MTYKIIHILFTQPEQYQWKALFIDEALNAGYQVEYWDITNFFFQTSPSSFIPPVPAVTFSNFDDFKKKLAIHDPHTTLINIQFSFEYRFRKIFDEVARHNFTKIFFAMGAFPALNRPRLALAKRLIHPLSLIAPLLNRFSLFLRNQFASSPLPDIVFASGEFSASKYPKSTIIHINSGDYDAYLTLIDNPIQTYDYPFAVFIDQNILAHPDLAIVNAPILPREQYYQELNRLFDMIEQNYQLKVVIAAHPKAFYRGNEFADRPIVKNSTLPLIAASSLILAHYSAAVGLAVAASKPIFFLVSDDMKTLSPDLFYAYPAILSETFNAPLINISQSSIPLPSELPLIDSHAYKGYLYSFLTWPELEHRRSDNNYLNAIKEIFEHMTLEK